jgi:hypothetical protein
MASFEIKVNGGLRFVEEEIRAITLVADQVSMGRMEQIYLHVGVGEAGLKQYLAGDLHPGDEITIRVLAENEPSAASSGFPDSCTFCETNFHAVDALVAGQGLAICNRCVQAFRSAIISATPLPDRASIVNGGLCGFCGKSTPEIPGLIIRGGSAICPSCLHTCADLNADRMAAGRNQGPSLD